MGVGCVGLKLEKIRKYWGFSDLATAATYLAGTPLAMAHESTIKAIANAVDEAGNITAGSIATYIMQSDHNAGLLWPNPNEQAILSSGSTDTAVTHLVTDTTRDLIGGVDLLTGTEVMLTLSDNTGNTGTYTVFAQSDGRYTLDFEDSNTYTEEAGSTFDMTTLTHGAQVTAIINSTDALGNVYTYDSASSDDGVQQDSSDDLAYEFEMSLIAPTFNTNWTRDASGDYDVYNDYWYYQGFATGDWDGDGRDEIFALRDYNSDVVDILFFDATGTSITYTEQLSNSSDDPYGLTVGDFNGDGRDDVYAITHTGSTNYLMFNTNSDPQAESTKWVTISENYYGAEAFDFDGDGNLDLLLGGGQNASDEAVILYGNGSNNFDFTRTQILTSSGDDAFGSVIQNDFNDDGKLDHLVSFNDYTAILFGDGAGNNVKTSTYNALTGNDGTDLLMGDFDGDGKDEIIGVDANFYPVLYSYDSSTNQFVTEKTASTSKWNGYRDMIALDYDGNGTLDVLHSGSTNAGVLGFYSNDGTGNFTYVSNVTGTYYEGEPYTDMLTTGDINGDGKEELISYHKNKGHD